MCQCQWRVVSSSRAAWRRLLGFSRTQLCELLTVRRRWLGRPPGPWAAGGDGGRWVGEARAHPCGFSPRAAAVLTKRRACRQTSPQASRNAGTPLLCPPHCWQTVSCWSSAGRVLGCRSLRWHHPPGGLVSEPSLLRAPESCWVGGTHLSSFAR